MAQKQWRKGIGACLEIGQEAGVLLGLFGDPVDRRALPGVDRAEGHAGRPAARRFGVDGVAVRAGLRMAQHLVEPRLDTRRDRALEPRRLFVRLRPAQTHDGAQQPFAQRMAPKDAVRGGPARALPLTSSAPFGASHIDSSHQVTPA